MEELGFHCKKKKCSAALNNVCVSGVKGVAHGLCMVQLQSLKTACLPFVERPCSQTKNV